MSPLGLIKHLTAVQRQHIQRTVGGRDLPSLWRSDDHDSEFRIGPDETIASVVAAYDEWERSQELIRGVTHSCCALRTDLRGGNPQQQQVTPYRTATRAPAGRQIAHL